jgi:hypothetical protein
MMTFDRVLPELLRVCTEDTTHSLIRRYCVVRDITGKVRIAITPESQALDTNALEQRLGETLGAYFVKPIISEIGNAELRGLASALFNVGKNWPRGWPTQTRNTLGITSLDIGANSRWFGIERTLSKDAWLTDTPAKPPWPLAKGKPPVVTFHSFKGGVGRTTLIASYAVLLASAEKPPRIAIIDLDLEAPGVGALFGVECERGILDVLVDYAATGRVNLESARANAQVDASINDSITIFPAGRLGEGYLQKLARLDYSSADPASGSPRSGPETDS